MDIGKEFSLAYQCLPLEKGRNNFGLVNIFHTFIHMWVGCNLNPRKQWCFKGDDY